MKPLEKSHIERGILHWYNNNNAICGFCGGAIFGDSYSQRKYCSKVCYLKSRESKIFHNCKFCKKSFLGYKHANRVFCSKECLNHYRSKYIIGEKAPGWKGGKTNEARSIRAGSAYAKWRRGVFERDNFTCQICGEKGGKLNAHHIRPFSTNPKLRLELANGITWCKKCHFEWHERNQPIHEIRSKSRRRSKTQ